MKKKLSCMLICCMCLMNACSAFPKETYTYDVADDLKVSVEKTRVFEDRLVINFSDGAFENVDEIRCQNADFEYIAEDATFEAKEDELIIYTTQAEEISAVKITVNDRLYYDIRYLDSDAYAMLRGDWADDYGYFVSGDEDAFYTEAEKEKQERLKQERKAEAERAFSMVEGTWESEDGLSRIVISDPERLSVEVYAYSDGGWEMAQSFFGYTIGADEEADPVYVWIEEARGYSMLYEFYLNEDNTVFTCSFAEGEFYKTE